MTQPPIRRVAVIDVGKTNVKLALVDLSDGAEVAVLTRPNTVLRDGPYPHYDVEGHWAFLCDGLRQFHNTHGIEAVSITAHGASGVILAEDGTLATPVLDYEHDGPDQMAADYDRIRPPFADTGSPRLPCGLNLGAQLHWLFATVPCLAERAAVVLTYPQYWGWRLTGVQACDVTSLGCHTDLWCPVDGRFSTLVDTLGLQDKMANPRQPMDILGPVTPEVAQATGLPPETPVACGIHDSNASLYPHLLARKAPFSVVSTGTWVVAMAVGGLPVALDPARDTLINVDAMGQPTRSARFMGGRTFDMVQGEHPMDPTPEAMAQVIRDRVMLLPSIVADSGPFPGRVASWADAEPSMGSAQRAAALGFHLALMSATCLDLIGAQGETVIEGAFARNTAFLQMLATATARPVIASASATGTSLGAALLFAKSALSVDGQTILPGGDATWRGYIAEWHDRVF